MSPQTKAYLLARRCAEDLRDRATALVAGLDCDDDTEESREEIDDKLHALSEAYTRAVTETTTYLSIRNQEG